MIEVLVILVVIALLVFVFTPRMSRGTKSSRIRCVSNLKNIGLSFRMFATDNGDRYPMAILTNKNGVLISSTGTEVLPYFKAMSNQLSTPKLLFCPEDMERREAVDFQKMKNENISYFVGLDAAVTLPQSLLAGDRNLTINETPARPGTLVVTTNDVVGWTESIHKSGGNVVLGDGSVQQLNPLRLRTQIGQTGLAINRLCFP